MKVSVIIPNWNGIKLLKICLPSLAKQVYQGFEVIVVDNGSTDGSVEFIKSNFPKFKIIQLTTNLGFAGAVNLGIKKSLGENIFLLNNDTEIDKDCLRLLYDKIKQKEISFVVPKMLNFYKRNILELAGKEFVIDSVGHLFSLCAGKKDSKKYNQEGYTFLAPGGAVLFKNDVFGRIGLFDESFFLYLEDADLSLRAQLAGFKGWYNPKAVVYHKGMATSSRNMALVECLNFRNMIMIMIKNFPISLLLYDFNWLKIILVHLNTIKYLASRGYLWGALKAEWYILINLKGLWKKRKEIQKLKIVSDQYIIDNVKKRKLILPFFKISF